MSLASLGIHSLQAYTSATKVGKNATISLILLTPGIVSTDQTAYIKGRGIFQNLRLIEDVIYQSDIQNIHGAIVALNFSKAFDSISKSYLITVLKTFNFPSDFVKWVEGHLYNNLLKKGCEPLRPQENRP